jgi:hypothetical protein
MTMKQVSKEDFEVLSKYHPAEIRYYADTGTEINRRKPVRVTVKRPPKAVTKKKVSPQEGAAKESARGKFVQLTTKPIGSTPPNSVKYNVYCGIKRVFGNDPTKVMKRTDLTKKLDTALPGFDKVSQITPTITALIKDGYMRYTGEAAS